MQSEPVLFALEGSQEFGESVASRLDIGLASHEERHFEDGEHKARSLVDLHGQDVYVLHTLFGDETSSANDKLVRLLFFIGAAKDVGARRVTALVPYLAYARKDRRTKDHDSRLEGGQAPSQIVAGDTGPGLAVIFSRQVAGGENGPEKGAIRRIERHQGLGGRVPVNVHLVSLLELPTPGAKAPAGPHPGLSSHHRHRPAEPPVLLTIR